MPGQRAFGLLLGDGTPMKSQRAFGALVRGGMRREMRAARIRGVVFALDIWRLVSAVRIRGVVVPLVIEGLVRAARFHDVAVTQRTRAARIRVALCVWAGRGVRTARMQFVLSRVCGTMRDIKRRRSHAVKIMRL